MNDDRTNPHAPREGDAPDEPPFDGSGDLDALVAAVFDERPGVERVAGSIDDPAIGPTIEQVRDIAAALRSVVPPRAEIADRNIAAALAAWDELALGDATDDATDHALTAAPEPRPSRRRAGREHRARRWSFAPTPAWIGAAAALVLVVAAGAVVIDLSGRDGSDDAATPALLEPAIDGDAEMFSMDAPADDESGSRMFDQAIAPEEEADSGDADMAGDAEMSDDGADDMGGDMDGDMSVSEPPIGATPDDATRPWVGSIQVEALGELVGTLLPGVPAEMGEPCAEAFDVVVAIGDLDGRPVVLGTDPVGTAAVAVDPETCRIVAAAPLP